MKKSVIKIIGAAAFSFVLFSTGCSESKNRQELEETYQEDAEAGTSEAILEASDDSNSVNQGNTGGTVFGEKDTADNK